MTAGTQREN